MQRLLPKAGALICALASLIATPAPATTAPRPATPETIAVIDALARLRDLDALSVSPDGRHFAVQELRPDPDNDTITRLWLTGRTDAVGTRVLADGGAMIFNLQPRDPPLNSGFPEVQRSVWIDNASFVVKRRPAPDAGADIWRLSLDGQWRNLTSSASDYIDFDPTSDPSKVLAHRAPFTREALKQTLRIGEREGNLYDRRWSPFSGNLPQMAGAPWSPQAQLISLADGAARDLSDADAATWTAPIASARLQNWARDGSGVAYAALEDQTAQGTLPDLRIGARRRDGELVRCPAEACVGRIEDVWWVSGAEVIFQKREGPDLADTALWRWRVGPNSVERILQTRARLRQCALASSHLVCLHDDILDPVSVVAVSLSNGAMKRLYDPNPSFSRDRFISHRLFWRTSGGGTTHADLVVSRHGRGTPKPLVITTYISRGFLKGGVGDEFPIQGFAAAGFAVLNVQDTAITPATKTLPMNAAVRELRRNLEDRKVNLSSIEAGVAAAAHAYPIDTNRIGMTGFSYGSELTFHALVCWPQLSAAITGTPPGEPLLYFLVGEDSQRIFREIGLGDPYGPDGDLTNAVSLALHARSASAPLLMNLSDREYLAALPGVTELKRINRPVEMHVFPDGYHNKYRPAQRRAIYERNVDWMRFWLMNQEDPSPRKSAQYQRWEAMRPLAAAAKRDATPASICS